MKINCDRSGLLSPSQLSLLVLSGSGSGTEIRQEVWRAGIIEWWMEGGEGAAWLWGGVTDAADYKLTLMSNPQSKGHAGPRAVAYTGPKTHMEASWLPLEKWMQEEKGNETLLAIFRGLSGVSGRRRRTWIIRRGEGEYVIGSNRDA